MTQRLQSSSWCWVWASFVPTYSLQRALETICAKRRPRLVPFIRVFAVWSVCVSGATAVLAQGAAGRSVLALEFAVSTPDVTVIPGRGSGPDLVAHHDWSADGGRVAFLFWGGVYVLDVASRTLIGPLPLDRPIADVALNSDGKSLLVTSAREARLYSMDSTTLLARVEAPLSTCLFAELGNSAFIPDAASVAGSVWISCGRSKWDRRSPLIALRYRLPSLELVEKAELPAVSAPTMSTKSDLDALNHVSVLTGITASLIEQPDRAQRAVRYDFDCLRLDTKAPCFASIPLDVVSRGHPYFPSGPWVLSDDLRLAAIKRSAENIDVYQTASPGPLRSLPISVAPSRYLRALAFTSKARMLVGAFDESKVGSGSLVVWDAQDGKVLQIEHPMSVVQMSLSPDRRKLLAITHGEIRMYAVLE